MKKATVKKKAALKAKAGGARRARPLSSPRSHSGQAPAGGPADKARGKEAELTKAFGALRALLAKYAPPYAVTIDRPGRYELWSKKEIVVAGKKRPEVFFAGIILQKDYVGFYYMPVYARPALGDDLAPALMKLLKGKSCFHVKAVDAPLAKDAAAALKAGHRLYKDLGWV